ncbi:hypothetical protein [Geothrix campi]|uniref:hypothetical protein n=1 Tax=Geothrix campi TaxID=2966450 RepID=UPI00214793E1|nr:hypothetical protein [Geothrix sp. SG10]
MNAHVKCSSPDCPFHGEPQDRRGWHLEKSINLPALLTLGGMVAAGLAYVWRQDSRVTKVEDRATSLEAADIRIENAQGRQRDEIRTDLKSINDKLDRLVERGRR